MKSGIYLIVNIINHKEYVGSTKNLRERKYTHWYELKRGVHKNPHLQSAWNEYGGPSFTFVVVEYCAPIDTLLVERETWWIDLLRTRDKTKGYNIYPPDRREISEVTKAKISASLKGRIISEEHRAKISASERGKIISKETREKLSAAWKKRKGRPHSEETKAKISAAHKGKKLSEESIQKRTETRRRKTEEAFRKGELV